MIIITNIATKVVAGAYLSRKKKAGYIIPTMNCYPRNGNPDLHVTYYITRISSNIRNIPSCGLY